MLSRAIFLLMMSLFYLKRQFYNALRQSDEEFLQKESRPYYLLHGLSFMGNKIDIAVPLRTNIKSKYKDETIPLPPNEHTNTNCFGGWHITKLIPVDGAVIYRNKTPLTKYQQVAKTIADAYFNEIKNKAQNLLHKKEKGEFVFGSIDIENAIKIISEIKNT